MLNTSSLPTHQGLLLPILHKLFPGEDILVNSRKGSSVKNPITGRYLELDVWIPKFNLCFEFQDSYHYTSTWYSHRSLNEVQQRDISKQESVRGHAETLILVPCWWSGDEKSLSSTIGFHRNDLFGYDYPISLNPPISHFDGENISDVGELMLASFPLDFSFRDSFSSGVQWWMGEKYDGIRVCWNPSKSTLFTRVGSVLLLESNFASSVPSTFLDAEVWFGRTQFSTSMKFLAETLEEPHLQHFRMISFDVARLGSAPFEQRYELLLQNVSLDHPFVFVAPRILCDSQKHINTKLNILLESGGEGIILRKAKSTYESGRSTSLLKIKSARADSEGLVTELNEKGVTLKLPTGDIICIPFQNIQISEHIQLGDIVTFSYSSSFFRSSASSSSSSSPSSSLSSPSSSSSSFSFSSSSSSSSSSLNVTITRIRKDLIWEDLLHTKDMQNSFFVSFQKEKRIFEEYANSHNLDPLLPSSWYFLSQVPLCNTPEGKELKRYIKGGFVKTLLRLFSDIGLDESKFHGFNFKSNHWKEVNQRRKEMEEYARKRGFNHKVAENWYTITSANIHDPKVQAILQNYSGSVKRALTHLFPEIGLIRNKFLPRKFWCEEEYRRQFLKNFARKEKFDYLSPESWYRVKYDVFRSWQGAREVLSFYENSLAKAVKSLFPAIHIDESKFLHLPKSYWQSRENRKNFFVSFANANNFDPLVPGNWYTQKRNKILSSKNSEKVLAFYNNSVSKALVDVFPDIGLDINKFSYLSSAYWKVRENRRKFFEQCAKENEVDPLVPSNWYKLFAENKIELKGQSKLLEYYHNNIPNALVDVFPTVRFDLSKFTFSTNNYWNEATNRRKFFEMFAKEHQFNPFDIDKWFSKKDALAQEAKGILTIYSGNLHEALSDAFPECSVVDSKFMYQQRNFWQTRENRKRVFENFARENDFDPLSPFSWYSVDRQQLVATKGAKEALYFHNGSIARAIDELFPTIGIDKSKFLYKRRELRRMTA